MNRMEASNVVDLVLHLRSLDVTIATRGGRLKVNAPRGALSAELRSELKARKGEILAFLEENSAAVVRPSTVRPRPAERYLPFPLTEVQQAYWIGRSAAFDLGNVATHCYFETDWDLDLERYEEAWRRLIERHDMLRAVVLPDGRQRVLEEVPAFEIPRLDLSGERPEVKKARLEAVREEMSHQVLPADRWPLFEIRASLPEPRRVRLHLSFDALIADARSLQILFAELEQLYDDPDTVLPPLTLTFRDYVTAHVEGEKSRGFEQHLEFWRARLDTLAPAPQLPLACHPSTIEQPHFKLYTTEVEAPDWQRLQAHGRRLGVTPSALLLTVFAEVLGTWSRSPHMTINLTLFNREPVHPQVNDIVGDFTSLILLEYTPAPGDSFETRVLQLQQRLWEDMDHRQVSGVRVLRELALRRGRRAGSVAMPVVFTSLLGMEAEDSGAEDSRAEDSSTQVEETSSDAARDEGGFGSSQTPQVWLDHGAYEDRGALCLSWSVVENLFPGGLIDDMFAAYRRLLLRLADDEQVWQTSDLALVPAAQLARRAAVNTTAAPVSPRRLHELFADQAARRGEQPAVVTAGRVLTYGELQRRARHLGRLLARLGTQPNRLVAVVMEKGWEQVAAVLGVLYSGAAYLPIDPELPAERRAYLLDNGEVELVLTQSWIAPHIGDAGGRHVLRVDQEGLADDGDVAAPALQQPTDLAYVIFTSGSTGLPKGVMIDHRGAVNTILDVNRRFAVGPEDRVLALSSLSFDLSVWDVFGTLAAGGTIVLPEPAAAQDPVRWTELMAAHGVTVWNSVPALMEMLVEYGAGRGGTAAVAGLRLVLMSGDWIPVSLPDRIRALAPDAELVSLGGATEASIWSILHPIGEVDPSWPSIPYGRPMDNQTFHVLDEALCPRPVWVPGELWIGGLGVALGYWRDEERSRTSFVVQPETGERLYRTGDQGRYLPDGSIEFLGREDFQVKIGGYRVELGEIEAALETHPAVRAAVVTARGEKGGRRLAAYVVAQEGSAAPADTALTSYLEGKVAGYMVPRSLTRLDELPLTANGKVDRQALPDPAAATVRKKDDVTPRDELERTLAGVWAEVLELEQVAVYDNFFELGGDSLLATQALVKVAAACRVQLSLRQFFEVADLAELARAVRQSQAVPGTPEVAARGIRRVPRDSGRFPLSYSQRRQWILDRLEPGTAAYNIPTPVRFVGPLDVALLERVITEVVRRHETLRTTFDDDGGEPFQVVAPVSEVLLPVVDLGALPGAAAERSTRGLIHREAWRPFDLTRGPVLRVALLRRAAATPQSAEHVLLVTIHHIVSDGWSTAIFFRELETIYRAYAAGAPSPLSELPLQYVDFAVWQQEWLRGERLQELVGYWRSQLAATPVLELPTDRPRPAIRGSNGGELYFHLPAAVTGALKALSHEAHASLFIVLTAAFKTLLQRYSAQDDFAVGTYIANRNRSETAELIGFFVNTLVLRSSLAGEPGWRVLLDRVRDTAMAAYAHQDLPFEKLLDALQVPRDTRHTPLFQVLTVFQNLPSADVELPELRMSPVGLEHAKVDFDLELWLYEEEGELWGNLKYNRELFDASTTARMARHWRALLEGMIDQGGGAVAALSLMSGGERQQVLREWSTGEPAEPPDMAVHKLFEDQAERTPDAVAVVGGEAWMSYRELDARASRLAHRLRQLGVGPGAVVGLAVGRCPAMTEALFGVLKAGAAYLPLDADSPTERLALLLRDSGARWLLAGEEMATELADPAHAAGVRLLSLEAEQRDLRHYVQESRVGFTPPEALAYVIYTSGSTGQPKGVQVAHRSLARFCATAAREYAVGPGDRVYQFANLSFDTSVEEIYPTLIRGATLVLRQGARVLSPGELHDQVERYGVTVLDLPTAYWHEMTADPSLALPKALRLVILGGEKAALRSLRAWHRRIGSKVRLLNTYGPTEATVVATSCRLRASSMTGGREIPIGRPLPGVRAHVLDASLRALPAGVRGELCLAGAGLARGYLGQPRPTAARFVPDPYGQQPGGRLYRSGDLAHRRGDGQLEFDGRVDHQVKLRGLRIELGEVEAVLGRHPGLKEAVVVARPLASGKLGLVAWVVPLPETRCGTDELRELCRRSLPAFMVPASFVPLDTLPLTTSGKVDRSALAGCALPAPDTGAERPSAAPVSELERRLAGIWCEVLGIGGPSGRLGVFDNFFDLGGDSLLILRLHRRLTEELGESLPVLDLFRHPTVRSLAGHLAAATASRPRFEKARGLAERQRSARRQRERRPIRKPVRK